MKNTDADVLVVGASLGGVAAAISAAKLGAKVILTESGPWIGGQVTTQGVPLDEHPYIERFGCTASYRSLRERIRSYYRRNHGLRPSAFHDPALNPGMGWVSAVAAEPRIVEHVLWEMLAPWITVGRLQVWMGYEPVGVEMRGDEVGSVELRRHEDGKDFTVRAAYVLDATELGDLLELGGVEHVIGAESQDDTGELHALEQADPLDQQAATWCFAMEYRTGEDHTIDKPDQYDRWRAWQPDFWPGPQLSWDDIDQTDNSVRHRPLLTGPIESVVLDDWWHYRRIVFAQNFIEPAAEADVTIVNWSQNDYFGLPLLGVDDETRQRALIEAQQLSLSLLYWMQTEAPRHDGAGAGYPELRLRGDLFDTTHGLAKEIYIREARRIIPEFRVLEQHFGVAARPGADGPEVFEDSVGIACHRMDLHPSTSGRNFLDIDVWPTQIPLGSLIPVRVRNLLPACKNFGTTHMTSSGLRQHHVEWNVGESAGALAAFCVNTKTPPTGVRANPAKVADFQRTLTGVLGVELAWPDPQEPAVSRADPRALWGRSRLV